MRAVFFFSEQGKRTAFYRGSHTHGSRGFLGIHKRTTKGFLSYQSSGQHLGRGDWRKTGGYLVWLLPAALAAGGCRTIQEALYGGLGFSTAAGSERRMCDGSNLIESENHVLSTSRGGTRGVALTGWRGHWKGISRYELRKLQCNKQTFDTSMTYSMIAPVTTSRDVVEVSTWARRSFRPANARGMQEIVK